MLHDAEHASGLERLVHRRKRLLRDIARHPIVDVAEGDDHVQGVGRQQVAAVGRKSNDLDFAVQVGPRREHRAVGVQPVLDVAAAGIGRNDRRVVLALVVHQRCDHLGIPTRLRPHLEHPGVRPDAEEEQRLLRMAVAVARAVGFGALRPGQNPIQLQRGRLAGTGRRARHEDRG